MSLAQPPYPNGQTASPGSVSVNTGYGGLPSRKVGLDAGHRRKSGRQGMLAAMVALGEMRFCVDLWAGAGAGGGDSSCLRKRAGVGGWVPVYFGQPFWRLKPWVWGGEEWKILRLTFESIGKAGYHVPSPLSSTICSIHMQLKQHFVLYTPRDCFSLLFSYAISVKKCLGSFKWCTGLESPGCVFPHSYSCMVLGLVGLKHIMWPVHYGPQIYRVASPLSPCYYNDRWCACGLLSS